MHPKSRFSLATIAIGAALLVQGVMAPAALAVREDATPGNGSVGPGPSAVSWTGPQKDADTAGPDNCEDASGANGIPGLLPYCSDFDLTVTQDGTVDIFATDTTLAEDIDLYVYDNNGDLAGSSASAGGLELVTIPCARASLSPFLVRVVYFTTVADLLGPEYRGRAEWSAPGTACQTSTPPSANFSTKKLTFSPSTLVSAHFLGSEPQTTVEHRVANADAGVTNGNRVFIDWPLSSRSNIGQLNRSLDSGNSFRGLFDLRCSLRSRPNCLTGGGGDTEDEVNLHTGTVLFSDQELVVNEAFAASFDHGDTFLSQTPVANPATAFDRQWIAAADNNTSVNLVGGPVSVPVEGYLTYHVPCAGQYVQGLQRLTAPDAVIPIPQPVPNIPNVGQSGQPRVDNNRTSPGYRWVYQPYFNCVGGSAVPPGSPAGSTLVATAYGPDYADPTEWKSAVVSTDSPDIFSWSAIDNAGNAYLVWTTNGVMFLSASPIQDARNNPMLEAPQSADADADATCDAGEVCGRPGSYWTPQVRVSLPAVGSAVLPAVIAGSAGRIGITYVGTTEYTGLPDDAPETTRWNTYAAVITNATSAAPTVVTGKVSHRYVHLGPVCTSGTTCTGDRSLLDMIDLGFDSAGRLGVVFTDNFSNAFHELAGPVEDESPFTYFSKQLTGPSVLAAESPISIAAPSGKCRADATKDAYWPNVAYAPSAPTPNLPSLDEQGLCMYIENGNLVAHVTVLNSSRSQMQNDLDAFNAGNAANTDVGPCPIVDPSCVAERLQYVIRFNTPNQTYFMSMEFVPGSNPDGSDATRRFFGGLLDSNDKVLNPANPTSSGVIAAGYHTDRSFSVTGSVGVHGVRFRAPLTQFGIGSGSQILSLTAFTMAGPLEEEEILASDVMRTVDATPPLDLRLSTGSVAPPGDPVVILTKTAGTSAITHANDTITYKLGYTNVGPQPVSNARIIDSLPPQVSFVSASNGATYNARTRTVTWSLGTVPLTGTTPRTVSLTVRVKSTVSAGTAVINRADFTGDLTISPPTAVYVHWVVPD